MLRSLAVAAVFLLFAVSLFGQTTGNLYLGYSFVSNDLHINAFVGENAAYSSKGRGNLNGWNLSGEIKVFHWVGVVADFNGSYGSDPIEYFTNPFVFPNPPRTIHTNFYTFLFGPRVSVQMGRIRPFAEALVGVASQNLDVAFDSEHDRNLAAAFGGGLDCRIVGPFAWRVQADYIGTRLFKDVYPVQFSTPVQRNVRLSTGVVFRF